jgi:hypothetical protein
MQRTMPKGNTKPMLRFGDVVEIDMEKVKTDFRTFDQQVPPM